MFSFLKTVPKRKIFLFFFDFLIILFSLVLSFFVVAQKEYIFEFFANFFWLILFVPIFWQISLYLNRAYDLEKIENFFSILIPLLKASLSMIILGFLFYLFSFIDFPQRVFLFQIIFGLILLLIFRIVFRNLIKLPIYQKNVLILGTGWEAQEIAKELFFHKELGYSVKGFVQDEFCKSGLSVSDCLSAQTDADRKTGEAMIANVKIFSLQDLSFLLEKEKINLIILAISGSKSDRLIKEIFSAEEKGIVLREMAEIYEELTGKIPIKHFENSWQVLTEVKAEDQFQKFFSDLFNLVFALVGLVFFLPFFLLIALMIKIEDPRGSIFYLQKRVGQRGREFILIKFRTMIKEAEKKTGPVWAKEEDSRQTKIGKFLRKFHLDELPQLINLIRREMNFVGPRPERPEFVFLLQEKIPFYKKRHLIKPGITGWAQVKFKYAASVEEALEKFQYELYYIKHRSFLFDLIICLKTLSKISNLSR